MYARFPLPLPAGGGSTARKQALTRVARKGARHELSRARES